jgi:hypothetical protein
VSSYEWHAKTLGTSVWEEVTAPIDCSYYQIVHPNNDGTFQKCSNPEDASTVSSRGGGFAITAPPSGEFRWNKGDRITWVKSDVPLDLYFLR